MPSVPFNAFTPIDTTKQQTSTDVQNILKQATFMANEGGPGKNVAAADAYLRDSIVNKDNSSFSSLQPIKSKVQYNPNDLKGVGSPDSPIHNMLSSIGESAFNLFTPGLSSLHDLNLVRKDATNLIQDRQESTNYPSRPYNPQELAAAHSMGISLPSESEKAKANAELFGLKNSVPTTGPVRAGAFNTVEWLKKHGSQYNTNKSPLVNFLEGNVASQSIENAINAPTLNRIKLDSIHMYEKATNILDNPTQYNKEQLNWATAIHKNLTNQSSILEGMKSLYNEVTKHPELFGKGLRESLIKDPELLFVGGGLGEAPLVAKLGIGALEGAGINTAITIPDTTGGKGYVAKGDINKAIGGGTAFGALAPIGHSLTSGLGDLASKVSSSISKVPEKVPNIQTPEITPKAKVDINNATNLFAVKGVPETLKVSKSIPTPTVEPTLKGIKLNFQSPLDKLVYSLGTKAEIKNSLSIIKDKLGLDPEGAKKLSVFLHKIVSRMRPGEGDSATINIPNFNLEKIQKSLDVQGGNINKALLATGAVTGIGATLGAYEGGNKHKIKGALMGGLAGLFASINMQGDTIRHKGLKAGQEGIFAGPKALDYKSNMADLAKKMYKAKKSAQDILEATGFSLGARGHWKFEISDHTINLNKRLLESSPGKIYKLEDIVKHPELLKNYKELQNVKITYDPNIFGGSFSPRKNTITLGHLEKNDNYFQNGSKGVLVHELQHVIQGIENWPSGGNSTYMGNLIQTYFFDKYLKSKIESDKPNNPSHIKALKETVRLAKILKFLRKIENSKDSNFTYRAYKRLIGEVEANNAQSRLKLTPEERRLLTPLSTETIAREKQIYIKNGSISNQIDLPISEHLKNTGNITKEGSLAPMILKEDKLPNESTIIDKAKQGDQRAISELYKQYMPRLIRSLVPRLRVAGPRLGIDAEDVAQHAFLNAITHLNTFKGDSAFYTWLHSIARNTALNEIVRGTRQIDTTGMFTNKIGKDSYGSGISNIKPEVDKASATLDTPVEHVISDQVTNMVKHAITNLPGVIKDAIKMREFEGLSYEEIANKQGVPIGTVRSRLNKGRDLIQQSIKHGYGARNFNQSGNVSIDQLKRLALITTGITAGAYLGGNEHHIKDAIYGGLLGLAAGAVSLEGLSKLAKQTVNAERMPEASKVLDSLEGSLAKSIRRTLYIRNLVASLQGKNSYNIAHSLEGSDIKLTDSQEVAKKLVSQIYEQVRESAKNVGLSMEEVNKYTTHIFAKTSKNESILRNYKATAISSKSPFTRTRVGPDTLEEALKIGLTLKHDNFADSLSEYLTSMMGAIHTKIAIDKLRFMKSPEGKPLLVPTRDAPYGYEVTNHPALTNLSIHPAIAEELSHVFDIHNPTLLGKGYQVLNTATKRMFFLYSLFHGQTLADVQTGMSLNPFKNIKTVLQSITNSTEFQQMLKNPTKGDAVDKVLASGMKLQQGSQLFTEDIGRNLDTQFDFMERQLNGLFPGLGSLSKGAKIIDHAFTNLIFQRIGGGLMGTAAISKFMELKTNWIKAVDRDPSIKMPTDSELMDKAVSFANFSYGSVNWRRMANEVSNKYLRSFLMSTFSPRGRRVLQGTMLAPEWLLATTAHWTKALFGKGSTPDIKTIGDIGKAPYRALKSMMSPRNAVDLHRLWLIKSLIYGAIMGNAINYMFTGKYMWENKDPFMIALGNGMKTPWMKELTDFPRLIEKPAQEFLNKLSPIVKIVGQQATGKKYLSAHGYSPNISGVKQRVENIIQGLSPISTSQNDTGGYLADFTGFLGHPLYGKDASVAAMDKLISKQKRREKRLRKERNKMYGGG